MPYSHLFNQILQLIEVKLVFSRADPQFFTAKSRSLFARTIGLLWAQLP